MKQFIKKVHLSRTDSQNFKAIINQSLWVFFSINSVIAFVKRTFPVCLLLVLILIILFLEGKRHDAGMLARSGLLNLLENHSFSTDGKPLCLYGDPAYPLRIHLQSPFRAQQLTPAMAEFNRSMSAVRVSVEWLFGDVINYFKFLDFKKDFKIGLSAVGKMYIVCALLQNAITCLYGNNTSKYFQLHPPEINEYFTN